MNSSASVSRSTTIEGDNKRMMIQHESGFSAIVVKKDTNEDDNKILLEDQQQQDV